MQKLFVSIFALITFIFGLKELMITEPSNNPIKKSSVSLCFQKPTFFDSLIVNVKSMVTATNMDTIFTTLTVTDTNVFGTIEEIPAGLNRKFEIKCYDTQKNLTYSGHEHTNVQAGETMTLNIILSPVSSSGNVIIVSTFSQDPPSGEKIVFQADYQGTYDIYIMNPDASNITQLTNSIANDRHPYISPDRSKIVFGRRENDISRPYLMNIDGSNLQHLNILPNASVGACAWSPDGTKFALYANEDGDSDIYIYDLYTEITTQIVFNNGADCLPLWSPDGKKITFFSDISGTFRIYLIDTDGSNMELLTDREENEEKGGRFSPTGSQIAIPARNIYSQWGIFLVNSDGTNFFEVLNTTGVNEQNPCWSPDGAKILFVRFDGGPNGHGLYLVNPDGTGVRELLDTNYYNERKPHWR